MVSYPYVSERSCACDRRMKRAPGFSRLVMGVFFTLLILTSRARATTTLPDPEVSTSDVKLMLHGSGPQPRLAILFGPGHLDLMNRAGEQLPAEVEIDGASVPVTWRHN